MQLALSPLTLLLLSLRAFAQPAAQDVFSAPLTFVINDNPGDVLCPGVLQDANGQSTLELRFPGEALADGGVALDAPSILLNGVACDGASPRTIALSPEQIPPFPSGPVALDLYVQGLQGLSPSTDLLLMGAVASADGVLADAQCPSPAVALSRALVVRFPGGFQHATPNPRQDLVYRAGAVYAAIEVDGGVAAAFGNGTRLTCIFAEAQLPGTAVSEPSPVPAKASLGTGAIVGIVAGVCLALAAVAAVLTYLQFVRRRRTEASSGTVRTSDGSVASPQDW